MQMDAKDSAFLTKFNKTVETRKKIEQMKSKDREMRYNMMLQKIEEKKEEKKVKKKKKKEPAFPTPEWAQDLDAVI